MASPVESARNGQGPSRDFRRASWQESSPESRSAFWLSIVKIFVCEAVVLLALAGAFIAYLNWSSEVTFAQFLSSPSSSALLVKGNNPCDGGV